MPPVGEREACEALTCPSRPMKVAPTHPSQTRTRTNTNPGGTKTDYAGCGEKLVACVACEVSVERGGMGERGCASRSFAWVSGLMPICLGAPGQHLKHMRKRPLLSREPGFGGKSFATVVTLHSPVGAIYLRRGNSEQNTAHSGRYRPIRKTVPWSRTWPGRCKQLRGQLSVSSHRSSLGPE